MVKQTIKETELIAKKKILSLKVMNNQKIKNKINRRKKKVAFEKQAEIWLTNQHIKNSIIYHKSTSDGFFLSL